MPTLWNTTDVFEKDHLLDVIDECMGDIHFALILMMRLERNW